MKIKVTRAFYLGGHPQEVGTELDVDARLAAELVHNNKAQRVVEQPAADPAKPAPAKAAAKEKTK